MRNFKRSISLKLQGNIEFIEEFTRLKFEKKSFSMQGNIKSREFVYDKVFKWNIFFPLPNNAEFWKDLMAKFKKRNICFPLPGNIKFWDDLITKFKK